MEQAYPNQNPNPGETEAMTDVQADLGSPREEFQALKRDYEALAVDVRNFLMAVRHAEYGQKALEISRQRVRDKPMGAMLTAVAAGLVIGRLMPRHSRT